VAVTVTLGDEELPFDDEELPPQPDRLKAAIIVTTKRQTTALIRRPESSTLFLKSNTDASWGDKSNFATLYNTFGIPVNWNIPIQIIYFPYRSQNNTLIIAAAQSFYIRFTKRATSCRTDPAPRSISHNLPDFETIS
jgi:uncharacterized protein with NAD-binding domain and iron-sulfur cluster